MASAPISPQISNASAPLGAQLQVQLQRLARRRNAQLMVRSLIRSSIWGVGAATLAVLAYKTHLIADGPIWAPAAMIGASLLVGARLGIRGKQGEFTAAREADEKLRLDDELSSALAFAAPHTLGRTEKPAPKNLLGKVGDFVWPRKATSRASSAPLYTNLVAAHIAEAEVQARKLDPASLYPNRFDKRAGILCVVTVAFVAACFAPDTPLFLSQQDKIARAAIMQQGEKLVQVSKEIRRQTPPQSKTAQELDKKLEKLGQRMARGRITKRAALGDIGVLKQEIQKAQAQSQSGQQGQVPQIAEALRDAPVQSQAGRKAQEEVAKNDLDSAARQLEQLADKLQNGELSPQEKQKAADDLDKVAQQLRQRGGEANNQAAQKLEDAANALRQQQPNPQNQAGQNGQQQGQQNQQQSGQQNQNGQQGQNPSQGGKQGQQGQQNQAGQNGQQHNQNGQQDQQGNQQSGQQGQNQQGGQKGQQQQQGGQQGQNQQSQQGQNQQGGQKGQQQGSQQSQQSQNGQQGGQQGQQQQSSGQQGQQNQQGNQSGQQNPGGSQGQQGQSGQSGQGASDALRDMANQLRQGSGSGNNGGQQNLQDMLNKLREAENGTNGGEQSGPGKPSQQGQSGQNGQNGQDGQKGAMPGKDLLPSDGRGNNGGGPGLGPRNLSTGNKGGGSSTLKSKRTGDKRRYEDIWSDRLPKTHAKIDRIKGKWGNNGEMEQLPTRGEGKGGQAHTPYYEVYESYKKDAEDAVSRESVPPAYKQPVKDYFESIKP